MRVFERNDHYKKRLEKIKQSGFKIVDEGRNVFFVEKLRESTVDKYRIEEDGIVRWVGSYDLDFLKGAAKQINIVLKERRESYAEAYSCE